MKMIHVAQNNAQIVFPTEEEEKKIMKTKNLKI